MANPAQIWAGPYRGEPSSGSPSRNQHPDPMQSLLHLSALVAVAPLAAAQATVTYERDGASWVRVEAQERFTVDPSVLSVRFNTGRGLAELQSALGLAAGELRLLRANRLGVQDLSVPAGSDVLALRDRIRATGLVEFAEENTFGRYVDVPNDPDFDEQENLLNTGQGGGTNDADCDAELAWDITTGSPDVVIAVIDSGTDYNHEDLSGNLWFNSAETLGNGIDDDGNGYIDDVVGWNFDEDNNKPDSAFFHGTFVAGIVGARTNNGIGIAGLAGGDGATPGCSLMIANVGSFSPNGAVLDDAILYAADNGADVITLSLTVASTTAIVDALDYAKNVKGVFVDCAAGNGFGSALGFPPNDPNVYAIGGTTHDDNYWTSASQGPEVWVSALGEDVFSTDLNDNYTSSSGTSFSAPLVAGAAGLILSVLPGATPDDIADILKLTADDVDVPGFDNRTGWGRLNAHGAVALAQASDCNGNGLYDAAEIAAGDEQDLDGNGTPDSCQALSQDTAGVSMSGGGVVNFALNSAPFFAGQTYLILGSTSGTAPGIDFGNGNVLPLNFDAYTQVSLGGANGSVFISTLGTLDGSGNAAAMLNISSGQNPGLIGLDLHHAYLVANGASVISVSNAMSLELLP